MPELSTAAEPSNAMDILLTDVLVRYNPFLLALAANAVALVIPTVAAVGLDGVRAVLVDTVAVPVMLTEDPDTLIGCVIVTDPVTLTGLVTLTFIVD